MKILHPNQLILIYIIVLNSLAKKVNINVYPLELYGITQCRNRLTPYGNAKLKSYNFVADATISRTY